jgi:outer membrane protein OmpA-like peptidoglycan-associated protein
MKPAYLQSQNSGRDRWMVSYLDVLTVLLILFVAKAAQTAQTVPHLQKAQPATALIVPPIPMPVSALVAIERELEHNHLDVQLDSRGVVVSLPQALLYAPGEDRINANALATVSAVAETLGKIPNNAILVGHADAVPIHNRRFNSNWDLAAARGLRLLELLTSRYGIAESRLSVQSYGSNDPRDTNDTADGRASNRRVEIVILDSAPAK